MHNIEHYSYPENVDKKKVQAELDDYVAHEDWQEGASGLPNSIRWVDTIYESREDAVKAIERADQGRWYNQMAVKYKAYPPVTKSAELAKIKDRMNKQTDSVIKITADASVKNRTSDFIGCPKCKSSLKRTLLKNEYCPLCGADLRSNTNIERISKARTKLDELRKEYAETERKLSRKQQPKIMWLVKIEYHT